MSEIAFLVSINRHCKHGRRPVVASAPWNDVPAVLSVYLAYRWNTFMCTWIWKWYSIRKNNCTFNFNGKNAYKLKFCSWLDVNNENSEEFYDSPALGSPRVAPPPQKPSPVPLGHLQVRYFRNIDRHVTDLHSLQMYQQHLWTLKDVL